MSVTLKSIPLLRLRRLWDGQGYETVARSNQRARAQDFLYEHGPGELGIYLERPTRRQFLHAARAYQAAVGLEHTRSARFGAQDGTLTFAWPGGQIPACFLKTARSEAQVAHNRRQGERLRDLSLTERIVHEDDEALRRLAE